MWPLAQLHAAGTLGPTKLPHTSLDPVLLLVPVVEDDAELVAPEVVVEEVVVEDAVVEEKDELEEPDVVPELEPVGQLQ